MPSGSSYVCAALLAPASGMLVIASLFIADRAPQSTEFLGIHLAVGAVFLGADSCSYS